MKVLRILAIFTLIATGMIQNLALAASQKAHVAIVLEKSVPNSNESFNIFNFIYTGNFNQSKRHRSYEKFLLPEYTSGAAFTSAISTFSYKNGIAGSGRPHQIFETPGNWITDFDWYQLPNVTTVELGGFSVTYLYTWEDKFNRICQCTLQKL